LKIFLREGETPEKGYFNIHLLDSFVLTAPGNKDKLRLIIQNFDIVLIDPIKWMAGMNYTQPNQAALFTNALVQLMRQEHKIAIIFMQIRKEDPRIKINPGELFTIKGAGDYIEDSSFTLLLERSELRGQNVAPSLKDRHITLYYAKHREATRDLSSVELFYEYDSCEFRVV
jgi:hypothetical protein